MVVFLCVLATIFALGNVIALVYNGVMLRTQDRLIEAQRELIEIYEEHNELLKEMAK